MLSTFLARNIITDVKKFIDEDIIIVSIDGIIIASSDESRVGTFHEGALLCAKERRTMIIYKEDEKRLKGVKNGLNLPIFFDKRVIGVIGITGDPEAILSYGELLRKMTELLVQESYYFEERQWRMRGLESFVYDWLKADELSPPLRERAAIFGVDLMRDKQFILINSSFTYSSVTELTRLWDDGRGLDFFIHRGHDRILLVHTVHDDAAVLPFKLEKLLGFTGGRIGVGQIVTPEKAAIGFTQAERALLAAKPGCIVYEQDLRLSLCLHDIRPETKAEFVKRILQKADGHDELIHTVRTFFDQNMSLKQTAETLNIHINTLHYRLKKWQELTKQDVRKTEEAVSTYLALKFLDEHTK
jgi:carbohydrate diacid regulator